MSEFSAMLGIECADVVSTCAMPILNALRALMGRSPLQYDEGLHARLCPKPATSEPASHQNGSGQGPTAAAPPPSDTALNTPSAA